MDILRHWVVFEDRQLHSRGVRKPGERMPREVKHEPGVFEITELVPAEQLRGAVKERDEARAERDSIEGRVHAPARGLTVHYHLKDRAPKKWAEMPPVEQAAYETGWLDASAQVMRGVREHRVLADDRGQYEASPAHPSSQLSSEEDS